VAVRILLCALALALCASLSPPTARAETLTAVVQNGASVGIPGLTVFLVHPSVGRSYPKLTDTTGRFWFSDVPQADTYYLEIYWGDDILYRKTVWVERHVDLGAIRLE
jgi:hypothetical protein